jgi:hypothetical protein
MKFIAERQAARNASAVKKAAEKAAAVEKTAEKAKTEPDAAVT